MAFHNSSMGGKAPTMLERCRTLLARDGHHDDVTFVVDDIRQFSAPHSFDVVVANFSLNVFALAEARRVLAHLATQAGSGDGPSQELSQVS